jgi:hypothetical protein
MDLSDRHPSVQQIGQYFTKLPARPEVQDKLNDVRDECAALAGDMIRRLPDGPELTAGLRKLLEAKDCFVRAALDTPTS